MSSKVKVVATIVSKTGVTLYTDTGQIIELKSDDYRTHKLVELVTPINARHQVAEVDLEEFDVTKAVEQKSGGLIKFFRVAKNEVKGLFGASVGREIGEDHDGGFISKEVKPEPSLQTGVKPVTPKLMQALESEARVAHGETTLVAVVNNIPIIGAEALESQIEAAAMTDKPIGFMRFMERLATVAAERKHTAQELLNFLKNADLPIADDGSIIGYKTLNRKKNDPKMGDHFVDCHTNKVTQRVGSVVEMDVEKVDDNRRVLCSNGLHIARRKYLSGYSGSAYTLVKIAPEDVISVPMGEPDKMRVARYHIVAELPEAAHGFLRSNKPMTEHQETANILGNVIKGNHVGVTEIVKIGGPNGSNITITFIGNPENVVMKEDVSARVLDDRKKAEQLKPEKINKQVNDILQADLKAAATTGNLAAALSVPTADPEPKSNVVKLDKVMRKKIQKLTDDESRRNAVVCVLEGMSKREAERKFNVPARTIGRLIEKLNAA